MERRRLIADAAAVVVLAAGIVFAFTRVAGDFSVFHSAWRAVLEGRGAALYSSTTDRFLYAPGFAWLLSPLGLMPERIALGVWCALKALGIFWIARRWVHITKAPSWVAGAAIVSVARPLLIDFQYGQVNSFILIACMAALLGRYQPSGRDPWKIRLEWAGITISAWSKLFPFPMLLLPFLPRAGSKVQKHFRIERVTVIAVSCAILFLPLLTESLSSWAGLMADWYNSLVARGLPLESHNQSFTAFLHHFFTGFPTHIISLYATRDLTWFQWLSGDQARQLGLAWAVLWSGLLLGWIVGRRDKSAAWMAALIGMLILPSHLIWKPYLVFALPLFLWTWSNAYAKKRIPVAALIAVVALNLTGFDFVGREASAWLEGGAIFLWVQVALLVPALNSGRLNS